MTADGGGPAPVRILSLFTSGRTAEVVLRKWKDLAEGEIELRRTSDAGDSQAEIGAEKAVRGAAFSLRDRNLLPGDGALFYFEFSSVKEIIGPSASLAFAAALVHHYYPLTADIAATGEIADTRPEARIGSIGGFPKKAAGAIRDLGTGGLLLYPAAQTDAAEVLDGLRGEIQKKGIICKAAATTEEAVSVLLSFQGAPPGALEAAEKQNFFRCSLIKFGAVSALLLLFACLIFVFPQILTWTDDVIPSLTPVCPPVKNPALKKKEQKDGVHPSRPQEFSIHLTGCSEAVRNLLSETLRTVFADRFHADGLKAVRLKGRLVCPPQEERSNAEVSFLRRDVILNNLLIEKTSGRDWHASALQMQKTVEFMDSDHPDDALIPAFKEMADEIADILERAEPELSRHKGAS